MAQAIDEVQPDLVEFDEDGPIHTPCCDENIMMCGYTDPDGAWLVVPYEQGQDCKYCLYILDNGLPCPVPGCPVPETMYRELQI